MFQRILSAAVTVLALAALLAPIPADAQPGHWRTEEEFLNTTGPEWQPVGPGVYELRRESGRVTRIGFGVESFRWALDEARAEQAELLVKADVPETSKRLRANDDRIAYLEASLARAEADLTPEQARLSNKASDSGSTCGGHYTLDVSFTCGMSTGLTTSTATWGEFGPYAPYTKYLYTYAYAAESSAQGAAYDLDSDSLGPFTGLCCAQIDSTARAPGTPTTPSLFGEAYVAISNGCSDFRYVSDLGSC